MPTQDIVISLKFNNYNYAPGIATYGIDGKTGIPGIDGNNIYFTDCNLLANTSNDLKILAELIANNYLPVKGSTIVVNRAYKNYDFFFDYNGVIYQLKDINALINNKNIGGVYSDYFNIAGKIRIADDASKFEWVGDRLVLNSSIYGGYDVITINNPDLGDTYINRNAAVNIISDNINENDNIEMIKMQSIDDIDIEDGKLSVYYKTTENAFYLDSNKPIVINGDVKIDNTTDNPEYDGFSTVLTSNDTITYFKHICNKLEYTIMYNTDKNQYKLAVYSTEESIEDQLKIIDYLANRSETVFGKIYTNENDLVLIKFEKYYNPDNNQAKPYLFGYIPQSVTSITTFSLMHNTEIFLTYKLGGPSLEELDFTKYKSIKLMRYSPLYYSILGDKNVIIPDEGEYFEYDGETVEYKGQICYVWKKYNYNYKTAFPFQTEYDENVKLLTNSLNLSLPFDKDSLEFVAIIESDRDDTDYSPMDLLDDGCKILSCVVKLGSYQDTYNTNAYDLPEEYQGLRILRKITE